MIEENRAEVKDQLEAWGVEISELNYEQRELLKTMIDENCAEVKAQLEEWGIEIPVWQDPMGLRGSLTDDQKEELESMRQEFQDAVNAKLEEWRIEVPEFNGSHGFGMVSVEDAAEVSAYSNHEVTYNCLKISHPFSSPPFL